MTPESGWHLDRAAEGRSVSGIVALENPSGREARMVRYAPYWAPLCLSLLLFSHSLRANEVPKALQALAALPPGELDQVYSSFRFEGVSQHEAEALFGSAVAAVYRPARQEVLLLSFDDLETARSWLRRGRHHLREGLAERVGAECELLESRLQETSLSSLRAFAQGSLAAVAAELEISDEQYLIKVPSYQTGDPSDAVPTGALEAHALADEFYLYESFEGDVWSTWSRTDNTGGQYTWGIRSCDGHWVGSYSADAARGGSLGATLGCSATYPSSLDMRMYTQTCVSLPSHYDAFLEFQYKGLIDLDGSDRFRVHFSDADGDLWGWGFYGDWSAGWYEVVFNLRQWYGIGDLGKNYCNTLSLGFTSDSAQGTGVSARVDDLYVRYGEDVEYSECSIVADPTAGVSPLTVAFRAVNDVGASRFRWNFGDGTTSEERDPVHVFTAGGEYRVTLRAYDGYFYDYCYASFPVSVTQGSCTYQISPTSATFSSAGGTGNLAVATSGADCAWTAFSGASWITITGGSSGTGSGTVSYSVAANSSTSSRSGTLTIGGQTVTVTQAGATPCTYSISPTAQSFASNAGSGTVTVTASALSCTWGASSSVSWISFPGGSSGTGSGTLSYSVSANSSTSARTGVLTIAGRTFSVTQSGSGSGSGSYRYLVPAVAHAPGANATSWRSDLSIVNRSGANASVTLSYNSTSSSMTGSYTFSLANGASVTSLDILTSLFGLGPSAGDKGTIQIRSTTAVCAVGRTYNQAASGTFGQAYPAVAIGNAISSGRLALLPHLSNNAAYRTNIGMVNVGTGSCSVTVRLYGSTGAQLGSAVYIAADPGKYQQIDRVFEAAGAGVQDMAYATVSTDSSACSFWAFAAVVDNVSGDPTTIDMIPQ